MAERCDVGVRHGHVLDKDMISVRISDPLQVVYVAAPDYWRRAGRPAEPSDLLSHRCIRYRLTTSGGLIRWHFERADERLDVAAAHNLSKPRGISSARTSGWRSIPPPS